MASRHIAFFILMIIGSVHASAEPQRPAAGVIVIAATIDGQPGRFLLDTGTDRSCLDNQFATRLALTSAYSASFRGDYGDGVATKVRVHEFVIGLIHLSGMMMLSADLSTSFAGADVFIDGILGTDVLKLVVVKLDFASGIAQFRAASPTATGGTVVKLQPVGSLYFVPLSVQGNPTRLLLDTGTNSTSISSTAWSRITNRWQPLSTLDGIRSTGGSNNAKFALVPKISVGGRSSTDVPLRIQPRTQDGLFAEDGFDGLLGTDLLQQFVVTLDLGNNRMYLTSNRKSHIDRFLFSTIGIQFAKDADGRITIRAVWKPSPAATAGLKIGDLILAVNDTDVQGMSPEDLSHELHGPPGTQVNLVIESDGRKQALAIAISCLLCAVNHTGHLSR